MAAHAGEGIDCIGSRRACRRLERYRSRAMVAMLSRAVHTQADIAREVTMAQTDWHLEGEWIKSCNCAFGCPCDFNARPTQGHCQGLVGMRVKKGHFGSTRLDGLKFAAAVHFPGALHEGNGQLQPIIDQSASAAQREALFAIMSG